MSRRVVTSAVVLTAISGAAVLAHELLWTRLAPLESGHSVIAFLSVLSAKSLVSFGPAFFLAGLVFPLAVAAQSAAGDVKGQ